MSNSYSSSIILLINSQRFLSSKIPPTLNLRFNNWKRSSKKSLMAQPPILSIALPSETGRVLSIQSHTVQGYVGNKSAVFPLQLLGYDVDPINSVQFSNHTGYPTFKGQVLNGKELWDLIEGLEANNLLFYTHLLTGYIGSVSFLDTVLKVVTKLRTVNPGLLFEEDIPLYLMCVGKKIYFKGVQYALPLKSNL